MSKSILRAFIAVLFLPLCTNLSAESAATAEPSAPKPPPNEGERGTIVYWQKELQGKNKRDVKSLLGTPQTIAEQGAIYNYPGEFFHPDLDQWRSLSIRFNADDLAESFTGEGSDTKTYKIEAPAWQQAADAAGVPAATPTPSPSPTPDLEHIKKQVEASVVTVQLTEPPVDFKDSGSGGTGFVVQHEGGPYIATNIHVLESEANTEIQLAWHHGPRPGGGNNPRTSSKSRIRSSFAEFQKGVSTLPLPQIKSNSGASVVASGNIIFSDSRDLALIPTKVEVPSLKFASRPPERGREVLIVGNADASHTFSVLEAEISQIGPDRFELDRIRGGQLKPGMSGSPVVDAETGEVLGIFTYLTVRKEWIDDNLSRSIQGEEIVGNFKLEKRYFAFRCDNLLDLRSFSWPQFVNDCLVVHATRERTTNVFWASNAYGAASGNGEFYELTPDFDNKVQLLYSSFVKDAQRFLKANDAAYRTRRWQEYQRKLENLLQTDVSDPSRLISVPYMRRELETSVASAHRDVSQALRAGAGKVQ